MSKSGRINFGGGGGISSDEVTVLSKYVVKGQTYLGADTNDEVGEGTLELTGDAEDNFVVKDKTYYNTDTQTKRTGTLELTGDATDGHVLVGKTYYNTDTQTKKTGTMPDQGAVTSALNCGGSYTIPAGYHNGSGKITANTLASQTSATAAAGDILSGKTAYVNGVSVSGSMTNRGAVTSALNCSGSYTIPAGYHNGSGKITANTLASQTSATAAAANIISGKTAYVNGSKITGTLAVSSVLSFSVAASSSTNGAIVCSWKNPAKGPFSGIVICAKTGSYPTSASDNAKYAGVGSSSAANATSSATISGLSGAVTYYIRAWYYVTQSAPSSGRIYSASYAQTTIVAPSHGRQAFTSSGTWTVPNGTTKVNIHCTGGGGAGGYENYKENYAGGGGGGGYTSYKTNISVSSNQQIAIVVGAGGASPNNTWPSDASDGSTSSATLNGTVLVSAAGGKTGGSKSTRVQWTGGAGGSGGGRGSTGTGTAAGYGGSNGSNGYSKGDTESGGGTGQGSTTKEFGTGTLYSGGGGGGSPQYYGSTLISVGGAGGGGAGGTSADTTATSGSAGTGGGGGGASDGTTSSSEFSGKGGSGNVIITW